MTTRNKIYFFPSYQIKCITVRPWCVITARQKALFFLSRNNGRKSHLTGINISTNKSLVNILKDYQKGSVSNLSLNILKSFFSPTGLFRIGWSMVEMSLVRCWPSFNLLSDRKSNNQIKLALAFWSTQVGSCILIHSSLSV